MPPKTESALKFAVEIMSKNSKSPGRPMAPEEDRIQYRISAKFSLKEMLSLKKRAESAGVSLYEYTRQALLEAEVHPRILPEELMVYKELSREMHNIGVNLNIVARKAISGLSRDYDADISRTMDDLSGIVESLKQKLV